MADEVLKLITTADVSGAIASFKQLEQVTEKFAGAAKTAVTAASQSFGKMKDELLSGPKAALEGLRKAADDQKTAFQAALPSAEEYSKALRDMGKHLGDVGKSLTIGLTVPLTAAAAAIIATGVTFDSAFDKIRGRTGATGAALESLKESFRTVLGSVPQNADQVSSVLVSLNQRLGLTGTSLEALAKTELDLARVTGENVQGIVVATTRAFENWQIATADQIPTLDTLLKVSQATGIGVTQLAESVGRFGPQFRAVGFSFTEAAVLVGKFEREGINAEQIIRGLNKAVVEFGKRGQNPKEVFQGLLESLKTLNETQAIDLASKFFGTRGAVGLVDAVRSGRFEINELVNTITASSETVKKAGDDTLSFADKFDVLKNKVQLALEPLGTSLLNVLETQVFPAFESTIGALQRLGDGFGALPGPVQGFIFGLGGLLAILGPTVSGLGFMLDGISKFVGFLPTATSLLAASGGFLPAIALGTILLGGFAVAYAEIGRQSATNAELERTVNLVQRLSGVSKAAGITTEQFSALRAAAEREASQLGSTKTADQLFEEKVTAASASRRAASAGSLTTGGSVNLVGDIKRDTRFGAPTTTTRPDGGFIPPPIKLGGAGAAVKEVDPFTFNKDFRAAEFRIFQDFDRAGEQFEKNWQTRLRGTADLSLKSLQEEEKAQNEIAKLNSEIRIAGAQSEAEAKILAHQFEMQAFADTEFGKTELGREQSRLREELFQTQQNRIAEKELQSLQDQLAISQARTAGGTPQAGELFGLLEEQRQARRGKSGAALETLQAIQQADQLKLMQKQYDDTFSKIKGQAEGVFDAIFLRGKKGFAGLLDYIKGVFVTGLKDLFGNVVATLFTGQRPGGGSAAQGGLFGGIAQLFGGGARAGGGGGGLFGGLGGLFGGGGQGGGGLNVGSVFGSGRGGFGGLGGTPPFLPARSGLGGLLGLGGTGAGLAAGGLSTTAATLTPGVAAALPATFTNTGLRTVSGAPGGGGFSMFGVSGAKLGAFFTNPFTIAAGIGIAATLAFLKFRKTREDKFRQEILRDFALNVPDMKLLKQIKGIGESFFGKEADKKRFETLRLDQVQGLLLNYAQMTGQNAAQLPLYQRFYGKSTAASQRFDPSQGIPKFGSGGVVPGVDRGYDSVLSMLRPGETVVPKAQFTPVGGSTSIVVNINESKTPRETGREVVRQIGNLLGRDIGRRALRDGLFGV